MSIKYIILTVLITGFGTLCHGQIDAGKKDAQQAELRRPQTPIKPYPYNEEEITFVNKLANITLAGTFAYPEVGDSFPAVILVHGSGAIDRDGTMFGHKPFLVISDYLTRNGFAVLRYDKRGVGKSQGVRGATTRELATDAMAAFEYLKTRKEVSKNKIGMIGHSEGGVIAPMCAVKLKDLAFIVLLAAPGMQGKDVLLGQLEAFARADGETEEGIQKILNFNKPLLEMMASTDDSIQTYVKLHEAVEKDIASKSEEEKKSPEYQKDAVDAQINQLMRPAYRFWIKLDSRKNLEMVQIPVLALTGEKDLWVNPKINLPEIEKSLRRAGNKRYKTMELPGLNHLFQHANKGTLEEVKALEETTSPQVLTIIKDWVTDILR